jgi:hypothetical protein
LPPGVGGASNAGLFPLAPVLFAVAPSVPPPQETKNNTKKLRVVSTFTGVFQKMQFINVLRLVDPEADTRPQGFVG